ncbi:2-amino-4-hydroxy-6-hydroxymethyldihydropteridine diphosphokinase [Alkalicoccus daliensis]|uniref:2-amino-4-hydroxy-6-hydroxymethyldihydropteridine diphosphokinase n=1 Tax=Alkalicoccus daliensis TaxID=745820 RepID=A0A1H0L3V8_9BACI|nr:2-amino-4-hydroxy-6-hydroxymethyldihydropteridine diphosphokinase [Alkalicoccus daliensis]SDO62660.1 2-amino-4-hydroxy-6-hydroxymethyldihydropteridinediphosphokinase [Alkalicoccus daliensis]
MISYISLGANIGNRVEQLKQAVEMLQQREEIRILALSSFYETKPVGVTDQPDFINAVVKIDTSLPPLTLLEVTQYIEQELGRVRKEKWGPRKIDLDLLLYGEETIELESLIVPHPRMTERGFVLLPLEELTPDLTLPEPDGRSISHCIRALGDTSDIVKLPEKNDGAT